MHHLLKFLTIAAVTTFLSNPANADTPAIGVLTLRVKVRSNNGKVACRLYNSPKGFPKDGALQAQMSPIQDMRSTVNFLPIPAGTYAVVCFHDENNNGKLDRGLFGRPKEGFVASNHAKGFMGPPSFDAAKFLFSGKASYLDLEMSY